ncbi:MAG: hypothetical protein OXC60_04220 [Litoreibacter sp.]|nr:hypothetical protein [Litoreibacter sp.]
MKKLIAALALIATPLSAQDFSEGSNARSWNLYAEVPATFEATVVDLLCTVAGDCANECGTGRQLGLLRSADDVLVYPNKNRQTSFNGAAYDLHPYCGKLVDVDGLMIEDEDIPGATNIYLVQSIKEAGAEEWAKTNQWTKVWASLHPEAKGKGPWFRRDPRVNAFIEADGYLGLGLSHREAYEITR